MPRDRISKRNIRPLEIKYSLQELYDRTDNKYKFKDDDGNAIMTIDPVAGTISFQTDLILTNNVTITQTLTVDTIDAEKIDVETLEYHTIEETGYGSEQTTGGTASAATASAPPEDAAAAFDGDFATKWVAVGDAHSYLRYQFASAKTITKYAFTTGNDAPDRNPKAWTFQGSNDAAAWTTLDTHTNSDTVGIGVKYTYYIPDNTTAYLYYQLNTTGNHGSADSQLAELEMYEDA